MKDDETTFDLHAVETRLGLARFGKDPGLSTQLLLSQDVPKLIRYCKVLQGTLILVAQQRDMIGADGDRTLGLLVAATEQAGGELAIKGELLAAARGFELSVEGTDVGMTLRTVLRAQEDAPGEPGASEEGPAAADEPTIADPAGAPLRPLPGRPRALPES